MTNIRKKLQSIDTRHGIVGTELHLTQALCDAGHMASRAAAATRTSERGQILLELVQSPECPEATVETSITRRTRS